MHKPLVYDSSVNIYVIAPELIKKEGAVVLKDTIEGVDISGVTLIKKKIQGKPADVILKEVEDENIDLVVMGSHGYESIVGSLLGSVSQSVVHMAKCPVLIVK
ncbi:Universal stress protein (fragment) [Candidatus Desulfosporosinus infrequens]|uniref:Universal stress protein n=1 Tax=Candidatus Desulfosporosinus infrequens TaxID=2043169 RepID=A0A2U3KUY1_9FIRM